MTRILKMCRAITLITVSLFIAVSCTGKKSISPVDAKRQAFDDLRTEINVVVSDPERTATAIELVDALSDDFETVRESILEGRQKVRALNADYDASKADFIALFEEIEKDNQSNERLVLELHRKLVRVTTAEEWAQLAKAHSQAMDTAIKSIQSN